MDYISFCSDQRVKVDFDSEKKIFFLSVEVFSSPGELPVEVKRYAEVRKDRFFNPCKTFFQVGEGKVLLMQELPFQWGFQPSFREQVYAFQRLASYCRHLLEEIAVEEKRDLALSNVFE